MDPVKALSDAVAARDTAKVSALLAAGVDPTTDHVEFGGYPVVLEAASAGAVELVQLFLDAGLPTDTEDDDRGSTPLICAVTAGSHQLVGLLIARGADVNHSQRGEIEPGTPLTLAIALDDPVPITSLLLAADADPNLPRPDGWTPLMLAAHRGSLELVQLLLTAGASTLATRHDGKVSALSVALDCRHTDIVRLLREHGAIEPVDLSAAHRVRSVADVAAWLASHPRPAADSVFPPRSTERAVATDIAECEARLVEIVDGIAGWLADHAPAAAEQLAAARGSADPPAVAELEAVIGERLPVDLHAYLRLFGRTHGMSIWEYTGLGAHSILATSKSFEDMREKGTFDDAVPAHIQPDGEFVRFSYWHPGWIPFAEDGSGNLRCIDLAPAVDGRRGQVISWEIQGGPCNPSATSLEDYLRHYRDALISNRYCYDESSGTYDPS